MLLTGNRVASAAQAGGSYYLNYARTCSALVSELEKNSENAEVVGLVLDILTD